MKTSHHLSRRVSHVFRENLRLSKEKKNQIIPTVRLLKKRVRFRSPFGIQFEKKKKNAETRGAIRFLRIGNLHTLLIIKFRAREKCRALLIDEGKDFVTFKFHTPTPSIIFTQN